MKRKRLLPLGEWKSLEEWRSVVLVVSLVVQASRPCRMVEMGTKHRVVVPDLLDECVGTTSCRLMCLPDGGMGRGGIWESEWESKPRVWLLLGAGGRESSSHVCVVLLPRSAVGGGGRGIICYVISRDAGWPILYCRLAPALVGQV